MFTLLVTVVIEYSNLTILLLALHYSIWVSSK